MAPVNYRPIAVPSNLLRIFTMRMCLRMTKIIEEDNLLGPEQFGFRKGRSTIDAVFTLSTIFQKAKVKR